MAQKLHLLQLFHIVSIPKKYEVEKKNLVHLYLRSPRVHPTASAFRFSAHPPHSFHFCPSDIFSRNPTARCRRPSRPPPHPLANSASSTSTNGKAAPCSARSSPHQEQCPRLRPLPDLRTLPTAAAFAAPSPVLHRLADADIKVSRPLSMPPPTPTTPSVLLCSSPLPIPKSPNLPASIGRFPIVKPINRAPDPLSSASLQGPQLNRRRR
jgi:hypothetical protein